MSFLTGRELMNFEVIKKEIYYFDRYFIHKIRCIPKDEQFIKKIINSRNRYSTKLIEMFSLSATAQKEYEEAKDEQALADIIIKDCLKKGITLHKREDIKDAN